MKVWIDVDNPPQVQYLVPFKQAFEDTGAEVVITARDYGSTLALLERAGVEAHVFGTRVGRGKLRKVAGLVGRAREFGRLFDRIGKPNALLCASRPAAVAARRMGVPSFVIGDYEYANVSVYLLTGSTILHPDSIDPTIFHKRGLRKKQTEAFRGMKEDITFSGLGVEAVEPYDLGPVDPSLVRVLFRPPSETSHYYSADSTSMAVETLRHLAGSDAVLVYSPREPGQVAYLDGLEWTHEPIVLERPAPFVALLKSVDAIVCSGGTMLREAAYLGIPAYSIFQSRMGGVDLRLQQQGRATLLASPADLTRIEIRKRGPLTPPPHANPDLLPELVQLILSRAKP
jgi:predicted glycosyltransferase